MRHYERGQVLPVWAMGIIAMLVLTLLVVRYADMVRWQIRAQNAADSAVQAVLALQTQQFNEMESSLYAAAVEEYRIRTLLYALQLTAFGNGGCKQENSCAVRYAALRGEYLKAVARYQTDIIMVNRVTTNMDETTLSSDANALIGYLKANCGQPGGGDCAFNYKLTGFDHRTELYAVQMDARAVVKPSLGYNQTSAGPVHRALQPAKAEVSVCADVPSIVPGFLNFAPKPQRVIARSAATAAMVEQDWFQPGQLQNPWSAKPFQPVEYPSGSASTEGGGVDWYAVDFGGNGSWADTDFNTYDFGIGQDEFSAYVGWWSAVPVRPFTGTQVDGALGCG